MTHNMPLRNVTLNSNRVDAVGQPRQVIAMVGLAWRFAVSGKIQRKTSEDSAHLFNHAVPQKTTCGNPMNEKDGTTRTSAN